MTLTERKATEMLRENTGRALCDSGDAYGRHWEQNQTRKFSKEPKVVLDFRHGVEFTINLWHWINEKLEYDPDMQRRFTAFSNRKDQRDNHWLGNMEAFVEHLGQKAGEDSRFGGIYGDGEPVVVNSYNGECNLSQTIQFIYWEDQDGDHVLLQVHQGCDVRGGYSAPKAFTCREELSVFDLARGSIRCTGDNRNTQQQDLPGMESEECTASWYTDDDYHWYDNEGAFNARNLEAFDKIREEDEEDDELKGWCKGTLYVRQDGKGLCPHCGSTLKGSMW